MREPVTFSDDLSPMNAVSTSTSSRWSVDGTSKAKRIATYRRQAERESALRTSAAVVPNGGSGHVAAA